MSVYSSWEGFAQPSASMQDFYAEYYAWSSSTARLMRRLERLGFPRQEALELAYGLPYEQAGRVE